jgi:hypothetical protein
MVVDNPPDSLTDGELVHVVQPPATVPNQPGQNQTSASAKQKNGAKGQ